ncbi:uncharacterized protein ACLA_020310 [Aspergillus clavatus NRRL 1]|uniref:Uncharacterized protein n=1 Tax=Aspergillus clavatus (strain ATCC 1007 / CBS 513.65 / DSM 816 / NCTC 3887 / NRRL 1 / QM 1276 / 107) TaxID=344612 RepID=A1CNV3_ASPCL|nr:uncharacterized protein ACLA_020310 [Aspergillus clavatus NRRL 1]EAW07324.1 conserved hypothetical protein [Aspergillus clavatus NRRL 1]
MSLTKTNSLDSKRRRFQPPITTFFSAAVSDSNGSDDACAPRLSHNHYAATTHSATPVLPAKVQSSLLSVGMRVRKSIAEGYKTKGVKLFDESTRRPSELEQHSIGKNYPAIRAELAPFCGMSKAGDFAIQSYADPSCHSLDHMDHTNQIIMDDGDAFSLPPSSQESVLSALNGQKRTYDDDLDEYSSDFDTAWSGSVATRMSANLTTASGRTILAPSLGNRRQRFMATHSQTKATAQERAMEVDDFEEPLFLRSREEVDTDYVPQTRGYEVEMGEA